MKSSINKLLQFDEIEVNKLIHLSKYLFLQDSSSKSIDLKKSIQHLVNKKENKFPPEVLDTDVNLFKIRIILICSILLTHFKLNKNTSSMIMEYFMDYDGHTILEFVYSSLNLNPIEIQDESYKREINVLFEKLRFQSLDNLLDLTFREDLKIILEGFLNEKN